MSEYARLSAEPPAISTKAELLERLAQRGRPQAEPHLTPGGSDTMQMKEGAEIANERRIVSLEARLNAVDKISSAEHRLASLRGLTRQSFARSR